MAANNRGLRLLKSIEHYRKTNYKYFDYNCFYSKINFKSMTEGRMVGTFKVDSSMCNSLRTLHGGYISTMIDSACIIAKLSETSGGDGTGGRLSWTTNMYVTFLKPAMEGDEVIVETRPLKSGKYGITEAELKDAKTGDLIAKGTVAMKAGPDDAQEAYKKLTTFDVFQK